MVRPADWKDVFHLLGLLEKHRAEYVLVGGYALSFNGLVRQTGDVDILVVNSPENNRRWIAALSELPDGAAAELMQDADDPFSVAGTDVYDDEPGVIRVADEFIVDVMPKACGLTFEDLRPNVRRVRHAGLDINVLDLEGLRMTKQGSRDKDKQDLRHIEAALLALRGRVSEHVQTMSRRPVIKTAPAEDGSIAFHAAAPEETERKTLAEAVLARAVADGADVDVDVDTLELYAEPGTLEALLGREEPIRDLRGELISLGVDLPRLGR
ncbi:hypothetical protein [uncultured Bosea sp.]|uniref:hypothetical protein n=1 Tax=uncultured Bosea sp. TaxID=211457 RepID=UPI0025EA25D8|nr:hypothetical protein [uncultured Bosea sp.]